MIKLLLTALFLILSGLAYRAGGYGEPCKRWMRAWICPAFALANLFIWWRPDHAWGYLLAIPAYGLLGGALTTYWKKKGEDARWYHWFLHGLGCGLAFFPFLFCGMSWVWFLVGALFSAGAMTAVSQLSGNVWVEEIGRGIIFAATSLLIAIKIIKKKT